MMGLFAELCVAHLQQGSFLDVCPFIICKLDYCPPCGPGALEPLYFQLPVAATSQKAVTSVLTKTNSALRY